MHTHDGYDSIRYVHIEIRPILKTVIVDSICEGDSIRFGSSRLGIDRFVKDQGIYYDTLLSYQYGCDSIIELRLNVHPKYNHNYQLIDIADKDLPYTWEHYQSGKLLSTEDLFADGEYAFHFTSTLGCDSVDSLSLRVHQTYNIREDTIHICTDQTPYTWCDHNNISESGEYTYYVSGVAAGNWSITAGGHKQTVTATEEGGLLVFTASAGTVTLTPKN